MCVVSTSRRLPRWIGPDGEIPDAHTIAAPGDDAQRSSIASASGSLQCTGARASIDRSLRAVPGPARGANLRRLATDSQPAHSLPGTDDVAFYEAHGWWVSPPILDESLVDAALAATESYYAGELDDGPPIPANDTPQPPYGDGIRGHLHAALRRRELGAVAFDPVIGAIAARLAGASTIRLFHDQLIYKPREAPGATYTRIGWHTDGQYWLTCTSRRMITAWIPLHDVDAELGSLMVLDRSHRWSDDVPGKVRADGYDQDLDAKQRLLGAGP